MASVSNYEQLISLGQFNEKFREINFMKKFHEIDFTKNFN